MTSALATDVVELRSYALRPGRREALVDLFDRHLVEPQEAAGARVLGQFRDLDRPDRFVWLRGFPDMVSRERALSRFYGGPVWAEHREAANATMLDSDDVLLLRPADAAPAFPPPGAPRPAAGVGSPASVVTATLHPLAGPPDDDLRGQFTGEVEPLLLAAGSRRLALLETEDAPNTFPRLPVRDGEYFLVRLARFADLREAEEVEARLRSSPGWAAATGALAARLVAAPEVLRLRPTARSLLR
jgi:NIPSNAP